VNDRRFTTCTSGRRGVLTVEASLGPVDDTTTWQATMGYFTCEQLVVSIDDRTLAHLQVVIVNKLRKGERFLMSWKDSPSVGDGRSSVWISPDSAIHFKFDGGRSPVLSAEWIRSLQESADSSRGLIVTAEEGILPKLENESLGRHESTVLTPAKSPDGVNSLEPSPER
jgi:hypothetical protein